MNPIVVLCPGQGAQFVGMGKAWFEASAAARHIYEQADAIVGEALGGALSKLCFEGPVERLNRTDVSQPAIFVTSVACWHGLLAKWGEPPTLAAAAGLSLGEYTALHLAGAISFEDALKLVMLRGKAMQEAAEAVPPHHREGSDGPGSGMVALIGADEDQAHAVCERARGGREKDVLVCANFNAPGQVVISGHTAAIVRAVAVAGEMGLRSAVLPVAGAFHSPLMAPAAEKLEEALREIEIKPLRCPVVSNVTALPHGVKESGTMAAAPPDGGSVRHLLVEQLTSPVRWAESCRWLVNRDPNRASSANGTEEELHEVAPGATLAGLMRRIDRSVKVISHDKPD